MRLHQTKKFCTAKKIMTKMKMQPNEWKKSLPVTHLDKGLITRIARELKN
jgi:hypothetical protein